MIANIHVQYYTRKFLPPFNFCSFSVDKFQTEGISNVKFIFDNSNVNTLFHIVFFKINNWTETCNKWVKFGQKKPKNVETKITFYTILKKKNILVVVCKFATHEKKTPDIQY